MAAQLAAAQIETYKNQVYAQVNTTDQNQSVGPFNTNCDCTSLDFDLSFPSLSTQTIVGNTAYSITSCINLVSAPLWTPQCYSSGTPDPGYKNIVTQVSWTNGSTTYTKSQEFVMVNN